MNSTLRSTIFYTLLSLAAVLIPVLDLVLTRLGWGNWAIGNETCQRVLIFAILGLGLNIVVGYTGLLHLGVAAFMAIGVYAFAISTCSIYPFQVGFWGGLGIAMAAAAVAGVLLGTPTLRLRGDYLAIVTLGFGEIVQEVLKNVDTVTKGMQTIGDLPKPVVPWFKPPANFYLYEFDSLDTVPWYFLFLGILVLLVLLVRNLEYSRLGRQWMSIREDQLAASCMGINPTEVKVLSFAVAAAICGLAGALLASKLETTAEPTSYDFNVSITVLCLLIVGGLGSIRGVLVGACIVMGFEILLNRGTQALQRWGLESGGNVFLTPNNWKFLIFGLALVLMMQFRPEGIFPSSRVKAELHKAEGQPPTAEAPGA
ncbi:MAG: branched-chain amino acid ABC transporter permease [Planctomycetia bacterium]|nr:branched-chain amino acid ABC transporter permease [Planctomycetia bacterium]